MYGTYLYVFVSILFCELCIYIYNYIFYICVYICLYNLYCISSGPEIKKTPAAHMAQLLWRTVPKAHLRRLVVH